MRTFIWGIVILIALIVACIIGLIAIQRENKKWIALIQFVISVLAIAVDVLALVIPGATQMLETSGNNNQVVYQEGDENSSVMQGGIGNNNLQFDIDEVNIEGDVVFTGGGFNDPSEGPEVYAAPESSLSEFDVLDRYTVGWSDNVGGRESYTHEEYISGATDGKIVFNSISDGKIGDEFNFVGARKNDGENAGIKNRWNGNVIEAEEDKIYLVRLYVHNNGDGTAEDVSIRYSISKTVSVTENDVALTGFNSGDGYYGASVHGFINAANASPSEYSDGVKFVSNRPFHLEYIPGTARYENNGIGQRPGYILSDDVMTSGVLIGYSALDGQIPGGSQFESYSTILVQPVFDD